MFLAIVVFLLIYTYSIRYLNGLKFLEAVEQELPTTGSFFSGIRYRGKYKGHEFVYFKFGQANYFYLKTKLPESSKKISFIINHWKWDKISKNIFLHLGRLFYNSSRISRSGVSFFFKVYSKEDFEKIFEELIPIAEKLERMDK